MDETDIHLCPDLKTPTLHLKGNQAVVYSPGQDEVTDLFGSVNPLTGEGLYEIYEHKTSCEFCAHVEHLLKTFPEYFIFLVGDNAPSHHSAVTIDFLKEHQDRIEFVPLPTYSPNLNEIERLWKLIRDNFTRNSLYDRLEQECKAIMEYLERLPFQDFIDLLGVVKKLTT
jgi:transposase